MIRDDAGIADVPVVMLTSVDQADLGRLLVEQKIAAYLAKPARSSALLETLVAVLQRDRSWKEQASRDEAKRPEAPAALVAPRPAAEASASAPRLRRQAGPLEILVVEDNEVNQLVFGQILDGLDIGYRIAGNGRTGVEMHRALKPQLILMDVSMPEMNGFEATAAIRRYEETTGKRTPIIGITAHALKGDREKCMEAGMDDYLSKPVSPDALARKVAQWLPDRGVALSA
jgi:CheY-like chemotaxis protein